MNPVVFLKKFFAVVFKLCSCAIQNPLLTSDTAWRGVVVAEALWGPLAGNSSWFGQGVCGGVVSNADARKTPFPPDVSEDLHADASKSSFSWTRTVCN